LKDEAINRFQFILLLIDDIEEAARYSRGGRERGLVSDFCDLKWKISRMKVTIELDYRKYEYGATEKFNEFSKKYKTQITRRGPEWGFQVVVKFVDKSFEKELTMYLVKDQDPIV